MDGEWERRRGKERGGQVQRGEEVRMGAANRSAMIVAPRAWLCCIHLAGTCGRRGVGDGYGARGGLPGEDLRSSERAPRELPASSSSLLCLSASSRQASSSGPPCASLATARMNCFLLKCFISMTLYLIIKWSTLGID